MFSTSSTTIKFKTAKPKRPLQTNTKTPSLKLIMSNEFPNSPQPAIDPCPPSTSFNYSWRRHGPSDLNRIHDSCFSIVRVPLEDSTPPPPPPPPSSRASPLQLEATEPWDAPLSFEPFIVEAEQDPSSSSLTLKRRSRPSDCFSLLPTFPSPPSGPDRGEFRSPLQFRNCAENDDSSTQVDPSSPGNSMYSNTDTITDTIYYDDLCQEYEPLHGFHRSQTVSSNLCQQKMLNDRKYSRISRDHGILRKPVPSAELKSGPVRLSSLQDRRPSSSVMSDLKLRRHYPTESTWPTFSESPLPVAAPTHTAKSFFDFSDNDDEPSAPLHKSAIRSNSLQRTNSANGRTRLGRSLSNASTALRKIMLCGR
ncbi:MAG: hypothetical protein Q9187_008629 [Circinaria calcarea]